MSGRKSARIRSRGKAASLHARNRFYEKATPPHTHLGLPQLRKKTGKTLPYRRRESLLTTGELAFYRVLRRSIGRRFAISIKTRLADVLKCPDELWDTPLGRRVCQKHVDFVLYDPLTAAIVAAIELDDRTHDEPERRRRDDFLDDALCAAGVVLVRVRAASRYDAKALQNQIEGMLSLTRSGITL